MNYRVYKAIKVESFKEIDLENLGVSWAQSYGAAQDFGEQFPDNYIIISAIVSGHQIDIAQTNAQWNSDEHCYESEVVLEDCEDVIVEYEGKKHNATINDSVINDETRPEAEECEPYEVLYYIEVAD